MKTALYFLAIIPAIYNPMQKLNAMEHDIENQSEKTIIKKSKINKGKSTPILTWCVDTSDLEKIPGEEPITRKKNKKKKQQQDTSSTIHQLLQKADSDNNTMEALKLMNTIQMRQNKESRELLQLVSDNTGKQITDILITINDKNDELQKQLARDNTKKSIAIAIFTTVGVIISSIITASST